MFESPELLMVGFGALLIGICVTVLVMEVFGLRGKTIVRVVEKVEGETPAPELLHIELSTQTGKPVVRLQGQPVRAVEAIDDPHLRAQVRVLLQTLAPTNVTPTKTMNETTTAPLTTSADEATPTTSAATSALTGQSMTVTSTATDNVGMPALDEPLKGSFFERLRDSLQKPDYVTDSVFPRPGLPAKKSAPEKAPEHSTDMFAAINAILQRKLRGQSGLPPIEILSGVDSLQIKMNEQIYRSIDDVPDANAQRLIRTAIDEWDR
jgi:hypothetical protein